MSFLRCAIANVIASLDPPDGSQNAMYRTPLTGARSSTPIETTASIASRSLHLVEHVRESRLELKRLDHFGYRDRLSQPVIEGSGETPTPGSGAPLQPGEFILGYPDEAGPAANLPQPEILSRNGSYMAYRRLQEHVGRFREFLRQNAKTIEEQELLAAKLMGRWRSGAPLALSPDKDDPVLGADPQRNNDFNYKEMDPQGYAVPLGSHARRMNPRDTAANMNRRRMIRRGATYGPHLRQDAPEDA
jgi:deferrochelatase/peroxidase EfeB